MISRDSILRAVPLFSKVQAKALGSIAQLATERKFSAGEVLMHQGDEGLGLYIIVEGEVRIEKNDADGVLVETASNKAGDFIGEFSVFDGAPRTATVIASTDTRCLVLASWEFMGFLKGHPEVALDILPVLVARFRETNTALLAKHKAALHT